MDQDSPCGLVLAYAGIIVTIGVIITIGSISSWKLSGRDESPSPAIERGELE
ncbi:hypothetical protein [Rhizobium sp. NXC14]|uniref:hypothetical protein n=1 Tax=Rhizobium sp. NXC14 TaxID=1981173 RepID=UPI0012F4F980|nr:hypothetical protein [Rhizobium sp. NXC14]